MSEAIERYAQIAQEVFEVRWLHALLVGVHAQDPRFTHDRKGAEALLRQRGWDMADVTQRAEQLAQGILVVPKPKKDAPKKRSGFGRGISKLVGGGGGDSWEDSVQDWRFLPRRAAKEEPATPEQRAWWHDEIRRRMAGGAPRARPWAAEHTDGYGAPQSIPARMAPTAGNVVHGLRVEDLFGARSLRQIDEDDPWA